MKQLVLVMILTIGCLVSFGQFASYIPVPRPMAPTPQVTWSIYDSDVNPFTGQRHETPPKIISQKIVTVPALASSNFELGVFTIKIKIVQYDNGKTTTTPIALKYPGENEKFKVVQEGYYYDNCKLLENAIQNEDEDLAEYILNLPEQIYGMCKTNLCTDILLVFDPE